MGWQGEAVQIGAGSWQQMRSRPGLVRSLHPGDQPLTCAGAGVLVQPLLPLIVKGTSQRAKGMIILLQTCGLDTPVGIWVTPASSFSRHTKMEGA